MIVGPKLRICGSSAWAALAYTLHTWQAF